ncbi:hypothetical protein EGX65_26520 [Escherichia coli]|uniref:Uncharacterized protein n=2 Tax=Enterobacteriaceae TaxID=543 RepID=A0A6D0I6R1_ECOLX|nr:hypothetical protein [Escherichia coli]HAF5259469.1 hypothetical protein [Salmonella enterica]EFA4748196.1 hypothetical protein [Escherichia coli]EFA5286765.1 hypothetical protein [Escherichia coli]EFA5471873.1 hypothetical protein [Escherichia coli]
MLAKAAELSELCNLVLCAICFLCWRSRCQLFRLACRL